jgi:REP element-mobilizing transposase RayT
MKDADELPVRKLHRLPTDTYSSTEVTFFFTICAAGGASPFSDPELARTVIASLLFCRDKYRWSLYCYCLMPDHLHFIAKLTIVGYGSILDHIASFKSHTTRIYWQLGHTEALWQKSSYDRVFNYGDDVASAISYVVSNPIRKGLSSDWQDYPYSSIVDPL